MKSQQKKITIDKEVESVQKITYLDSMITVDGDTEKDVRNRLIK